MATGNGPATLDDLLRTKWKAELVRGKIVTQSPVGVASASTAGNILVSLREYVKHVGHGKALGGMLAYAVPALATGRESFSPDASYYNGPLPANLMRFVEGPPTFAVEVRSENDYGPTAEEEMHAKRIDYFAAGTLVVWDVDPIAETIACYRADQLDQATIFRCGMTADAEPAVPGWRMKVDDVFA